MHSDDPENSHFEWFSNGGQVSDARTLHRRLIAWAPASVLLVAILSSAASAQDDSRSYRLSLRPSVGMGGGNLALGGHFGLAGDLWLGDVIGLGVHGALLSQSEVLGDESSAATVALVGSFRSAARGSYWFLSLGAGYASATHVENARCIDLFGTGCSTQTTTYDAYTVATALGYLAHPGGSWFEIGPVLRVDVVSDPARRMPTDFVATLNITLGYGLLR